jgi:hypothetical protein
MNLKTRVACLALIIAVLLAGCGGTAATPEIVDTVAVPPASPTSPSPSATMPPPSPTAPPPTKTQSPPTPTLPPPTETPPPAAAPETPVSSPAPTQANLPIVGVWTGGGSNLLLDFEVQNSAGQATISNVGILWEGRDECELNVRLDVSVPVEDSGFELTYQADEFSLVMTGVPASSTRFLGVLNFRIDNCGDHELNWQAVPKPGASQ